MKKWFLIAIGAVLLLIIGVPVFCYNDLVQKQVKVDEAMAEIDTQLQRRMDLIPQLTETVKSFTAHESEVFDEVNQAREKLAGAQDMSEKAEANEELTTALNSLIAVAEAYPELKSDKVYIGLMDELAGTENRIAYARSTYNEAVSAYNQSIRRFPAVIFAQLFGFEKAEFFEADEAADEVPQLNLDS